MTSKFQAPEIAPIDSVPGGPGEGTVEPTQIRKPWRSTARTLFQALIALAVLFPILVEATGLKVEDAGWLVIPLGVAAALARLMALPQVEVFLRDFFPFLSASGSQSPPLRDEDGMTSTELALLILAACSVVAVLVLLFGAPFSGGGNGR